MSSDYTEADINQQIAGLKDAFEEICRIDAAAERSETGLSNSQLVIIGDLLVPRID